MTEQDAIENAISDYFAYDDAWTSSDLAQHIIKHMREHSPYVIVPMGGMHLSDPNSHKGAKKW